MHCLLLLHLLMLLLFVTEIRESNIKGLLCSRTTFSMVSGMYVRVFSQFKSFFF